MTLTVWYRYGGYDPKKAVIVATWPGGFLTEKNGGYRSFIPLWSIVLDGLDGEGI